MSHGQVGRKLDGMLALLIAALTTAAPHSASGADATAPVTVEVSNVRDGAGRVRVALCTAATFMQPDCPYFDDAPATAGTTEVTLYDVPAGVYAAQVFHDRNDNGRVDRGAFGVPLEGVGFSNNAPIGLTGPKFSRAAFRHGAEPQTISVRLKHYR